jgi:hypothetical protein
VKIQAVLDPDVPDRLRRPVATNNDVYVIDGWPQKLRVNGAERGLVLLPRPQSQIDLHDAIADLRRRVPRGIVGMVAAAAIPVPEREALEEAGLSWCDARGALHLQWPGMYVHIDRGPGRTARTTSGAAPGLGPAGVRAVQVLLGHRETTDWTVSALAQEAGVSVGQAHKVFRVLESNRLVATHGKGPRQRRLVSDRTAALDWLAMVDRARRPPDRAFTYLYGRALGEVAERFAATARDAGLPYALTGAAASVRLGSPTITSVPVLQVRVGVLGAADAIDRLGLERLDAEEAARGANLELWTDTGELGTFRAEDHGGVFVAPAIRVWLDMARQGGRLNDAAQLFRERFVD